MNSVKDHRVLSKGNDKINILFEGTKNFWRTRTMIDIIIAHHTYFNIIEIIAYNPEIDVEANRIYIDYENLVKNLSKIYYIEKLSQETEILVRQKINFCKKEVATRVINDIIANNIQSQLEIHNEKSELAFSVSLRYDFGIDIIPLLASDSIMHLNSEDEKAKRIKELVKLEEILIPKPILLDPLETVHLKQLSPNVIATFYEYLKYNEYLYKKVRSDSNYAHYLERLAATCIDTIKRVFKDRKKLKINNSQKLSKNDHPDCDEETEQYSTPRKRWIKAIDKVINKNFVSRVREKIAESPFLTSLMSIKPKYYFQHYLDKTSPQKGNSKPELNGHFDSKSDKDIGRSDSKVFPKNANSSEDNVTIENMNFFASFFNRNAKKKIDRVNNHAFTDNRPTTSHHSPLLHNHNGKNKFHIANNEEKSITLSSSLPSLITNQNGSNKSHNGSDKVKLHPSVRHLGDTKSSLLYKASAAKNKTHKLSNSNTSDVSILPKMSKHVSFSPDNNTTSFADSNDSTKSADKLVFVNSSRFDKTPSIPMTKSANENFACEVSSYHYGEQIKPADRFDKWEWYNTMKASLPDKEFKPSSASPDLKLQNNYIDNFNVNNRLMKLGSLKLQSMEDLLENNNNNDKLTKSPSRSNRNTIDNSNIIISPKSLKGFFTADSDKKVNNINNDNRLHSISEEHPFIDKDTNFTGRSDLSNIRTPVTDEDNNINNNNGDRPSTPFDTKHKRRMKNMSLHLTIENVTSVSPGKTIIDSMINNSFSPKSQHVNNVITM